MWVLGNKLGSSARATRALLHLLAISPAPYCASDTLYWWDFLEEHGNQCSKTEICSTVIWEGELPYVMNLPLNLIIHMKTFLKIQVQNLLDLRRSTTISFWSVYFAYFVK